MAEGRIHLIHCSYHKCLTVYFRRVADALFNLLPPWGRGYRHFNSDLEGFRSGFRELRVASINNRVLDLGSLERFRLSRFLRDPRDLVVSGYFYHRRGAEPWTLLEAPTERDWAFANGVVPVGVRAAGGSFAGYLQSVPEEDGLLAELEFRARHFESMERWPEDHPDVLTQRYEEVVGDEEASFARIFEHFGLAAPTRWLGVLLARRYALRPGRQAAVDAHVRDPTAGQWRRHFTPALERELERRHPTLIGSLGYPES